MVGLTDLMSKKFIDHLDGKTSAGATAATYFGLLTAVGTDGGSGFTEVSGGSYARVTTSGATWNAAGGSAPSSAANAAALTWPTPTADWAVTPNFVIAVGVFDALSGGNLLAWDYIGGDWLPFSCTSASPGVVTCPGHGFSNGDVAAVTAELGGTLPTTGGSWSGLLTVANVTTDTFTLGVNTTGTGGGMLKKVLRQQVANNVQPSFAIGALTFKMS